MVNKILMRRCFLIVMGVLALFTLMACGVDDDLEEAVEPHVKESIEATTVEAGDALETSDLSGSFEHPLTGEAVSGTLEWANPSLTLEEDTEVRWRFTPDQTQLLEIEGTIMVPVTKQDHTDDETGDENGDETSDETGDDTDEKNGDDTGEKNGDDTDEENGDDTDLLKPVKDSLIDTEIISSGDMLSATSLDGAFIDPDTKTAISGTFEWVDPAYSPEISGEYEWRFIPNDTDMYETVTGTTFVSVDPALENLSLDDSYKEGGMTFEIYEVDMEDKTESPLRELLLNRGYEPFEPSTGIETYITEMVDTVFGGNYYKSDTTYLYVYQPSDSLSLAVTVEIPIETLMRRLDSDHDPLPDEDSQGKDYEEIPRYEGSVIMKDQNWLGGQYSQGILYPWDGGRLDYGIHEDDASPEDIYGFYKAFFTDDADWEITHEKKTASGHYELIVEKEGLHIGVRTYDTFYTYPSEVLGYSIYKQTWTQDEGPLPEDDPIEDPEILSRFPGSVALYENEEMFFNNRDHMTHYGKGYPVEYREIIYGAEASVNDVYSHFLSTFIGDDDWTWIQGNGVTDWSDFIFSNMWTVRGYKDGYSVEITVFNHSEYEDAVSYAVLIWALPDLPEEDRYEVEALANVPRHPNSVLVEHKDPEKEPAEYSEYFYATKTPLLDVRDFYIDTLPDEWEITSDVTTNNYLGTEPIMFAIMAESDDQHLTIKGEYGRQFAHSTTIHILRADKKEPLPEADLEGEDLDEVERYPGSIIFYHFDELDIVQAVGYSVEERLVEVYEYYLNDHFDDSWTLVYETYIPYSHTRFSNAEFTVHYRKDHLNVEITGKATSQYLNAVNYHVEVYYGSDGDLPEDDIMGEDFTMIERYPDSVILIAEEEMLIYGTMDSLEAVRTHYEDYLNAEGWSIVQKNENETEFDISAMKGLDTMVMIQGTTESDYEDAVEITIIVVE